MFSFIKSSGLVFFFLCLYSCNDGRADFSSLPQYGENIPDSDYFFINLSSETYTRQKTQGQTFLIYESEAGVGYDCKIPIDSDPAGDLYCYVEAHEGDLFIEELKLDYNIPQGMCNYLNFQTHWHFNQPVGMPEGEGERRDILSCTSSNSTRYYWYSREDASDGCKELCNRNEQTLGPVDNPLRFCAYDYTALGLANGCVGSYREYTCEQNSTGDGDSQVIEWVGPVDSGNTSWGGSMADAIGGLGHPSLWSHYASSVLQGKDGTSAEMSMPTAVIQNVYQGYRGEYAIAPLGDIMGNAYHSTIPIANYYEDLENHDFDSDTPEFYKSYEILGEEIKGHPYISWACLDASHETLHSIHIMIREWNTKSQFLEYVDSEGDSGDSDEEGEEGDDCDNYEPDQDLDFNNTTCNDLNDVDDFFDGELKSIIECPLCDENRNYPGIQYSSSSEQ